MDRKKFDGLKNKTREYAYQNIGPVVYEYTLWVLNELCRLGIKKVYFLARDGCLPYKIACELCKSQFSGIEPKYVYCSRLSLRTPTYHLIGDEAFRLLTLNGYLVTPRSVLKRALLNESTQSKILLELGIDNADRPLGKRELDIFRAKLSKNELYKSEVYRISKEAYDPAIKYFKDMGLFNESRIAIVDSGWSGSMQRSLRQLLESAGYRGKIYGFYFGMYDLPKERCDGKYFTFYFSKKEGLLRKVNFNNNLFECMLSAPHPMTVGYVIKDNRACPVFASEASKEMAELIDAQIDSVLDYVKSQLHVPAVQFNKRRSVSICYRILKRAMTRPTVCEAEIYSHFMFCDDVTDAAEVALSAKEYESRLRHYLFIPRLIKRVFKQDKREASLMWVHGVIAYLNKYKQIWYRLNVFLWNIIKFLA